MIKINKVEDIKYKDFKEVESIMVNIDKASTEDITKVFKVFYKVSDEEIKKIRWEEIISKVNIVVLLISKEFELITKFESDGVKYGFIPNFSEITTGELIDLDNLLQDKNFEGIASILYRPIVKEDKNGKYEIEEYKGFNEETFSNAYLGFYLGFINFFFKSYQILRNSSLTSTIQK